MTWTYAGAAASEKDAVRFYVQDTDHARPLLSDEDIAYLLVTWTPVHDSVIYVASMAAEMIASKYAAEISMSGDGVSVQTGDLQRKYTDLAARLRNLHEASRTNDLSRMLDVMVDLDYDPSIKPLMFGVGAMDNFDAGLQDYGTRALVPSEHLE